MAELLRLVKYYNLPIYIYPYIVHQYGIFYRIYSPCFLDIYRIWTTYMGYLSHISYIFS